MKTLWSNRALRDLREIRRFIAQDNPAAAAGWIERLVERAEKAGLSPMAGRKVPEFGREEIREVLERSYRIIYYVKKDGIVVLTVFEGHRRLPVETIPR
jgi:toxin ParE1/3/4